MAVALLLLTVAATFVVGYVYGHVRGSRRGYELGCEEVEVEYLGRILTGSLATARGPEEADT